MNELMIDKNMVRLSIHSLYMLKVHLYIHTRTNVEAIIP